MFTLPTLRPLRDENFRRKRRRRGGKSKLPAQQPELAPGGRAAATGGAQVCGVAPPHLHPEPKLLLNVGLGNPFMSPSLSLLIHCGGRTFGSATMPHRGTALHSRPGPPQSSPLSQGLGLGLVKAAGGEDRPHTGLPSRATERLKLSLLL